MPNTSLLLLLALSPLTALADTPQQPPCNRDDFFSTQFDYTVGRVVDTGQVLLLGEGPGCLNEERAGCASGDEIEPGTSLAIGNRWNEHYCVQSLEPGNEVAGWAPAPRVMKTGQSAENEFSDWIAHWEGSGGRAIDIVLKGGMLELSVPGAAGAAASTRIGSATPEEISGELLLEQGDCQTRVSLQGMHLVVADNGHCQAPAAALRGVYRNRAPMERLMQLMER